MIRSQQHHRRSQRYPRMGRRTRTEKGRNSMVRMVNIQGPSARAVTVGRMGLILMEKIMILKRVPKCLGSQVTKKMQQEMIAREAVLGMRLLVSNCEEGRGTIFVQM